MEEPMGIPFGCNFNSFRRVYARAWRTCKIVVSDFHYHDPFGRDTHVYDTMFTNIHTYTPTYKMHMSVTQFSRNT